jgi:hypothetical protein
MRRCRDRLNGLECRHREGEIAGTIMILTARGKIKGCKIELSPNIGH